MEGWPVAGRLAGAAVDDEVFRALGDLRVEIVAEHPQRRLLLPASGTELGAAGRSDRGRDAHADVANAPIFASRPLRTSSMAAWISGSSTRSWSSGGTFSRIAACASPVRRPSLRRGRTAGALAAPE